MGWCSSIAGSTSTQAARLQDPPFSDLASKGPEALFSDEQVERICDLHTSIERQASVAQAA
jgi:hypothetical protein